MSLARYKKLTLIDVYLKYPFKKNIKTSLNTIPQPFIKHSECTDTKLSVDWKQWSEIVSLYIEKLKLHIEDGNGVELGTRQGNFMLQKVKLKSFVDRKKSAEQGKQVRFAKNNIDNYYFLPSWGKTDKWRFRSFWTIKLNRQWMCDLYKKCELDYTQAYKIKNK